MRYLFLCLTLSIVNAYKLLHSVQRFSLINKMSEEDPNFMAHLPTLLKKGLEERPSYDIAKELRSRYKIIETVKRKASDKLKSSNPELAAELEEIADDLNDTHEKFVNAALYWDAWSRPDPDLPRELRKKDDEKKKDLADPNFASNLSKFMSAAKNDRESPDLPSELRMMKYKQSADVKRLAAKELKRTPGNEKMAEELLDIADEIEESHSKFVEMVNTMREARDKYESTSKSTR